MDFLIKKDSPTPNINIRPITKYGKYSIPVLKSAIASTGPIPAPINRITVCRESADPLASPPIMAMN